MKILNITEDKENNRFKVVINNEKTVYINRLRDLESALKGIE